MIGPLSVLIKEWAKVLILNRLWKILKIVRNKGSFIVLEESVLLT